MKNLMSYYKNKRGMGILEAMIMLSIGLLILTAINQLFKKMAVSTGEATYKEDLISAKNNTIQVLKDLKAWSATRSKAGSLNLGCFPGREDPAAPGVPCPVMHYHNPLNPIFETDYIAGAKRWIVPIIGSNEGVGLISLNGEIFYSADSSCDNPYNTIQEYEACMNKEKYIIIKIKNPPGAFIERAYDGTPPFDIFFIDNFKTKTIHKFSLAGYQDKLHISLGFTPGTGWEEQPGLSGYCRIAIGEGAGASGECAIAIGNDSNAASDNSIALGPQASATGGGDGKNIAIGYFAQATNQYAIALGTQAIASGDKSIAIGREAQASGIRSMAIGANARAPADYSTAIGNNAQTNTEWEIRLGGDANAWVVIGGAHPHRWGRVTAENNPNLDEKASSISAMNIYTTNVYSSGIYKTTHSPWSAGSSIYDLVFDIYFDDFVLEEDKKLYSKYKAFLPQKGYSNLENMINFVKEKRHLPFFPGRATIEKGEGLIDLDEKANKLWLMLELNAIYIKELNEEINETSELNNNSSNLLFKLKQEGFFLNEKIDALEKNILQLEKEVESEYLFLQKKLQRISDQINYLSDF